MKATNQCSDAGIPKFVRIFIIIYNHVSINRQGISLVIDLELLYHRPRTWTARIIRHRDKRNVELGTLQYR